MQIGESVGRDITFERTVVGVLQFGGHDQGEKTERRCIALRMLYAKPNRSGPLLEGHAAHFAGHTMLDAAPQHPATQQKRVDKEHGALLFRDDQTNEAIIAKPVLY